MYLAHFGLDRLPFQITPDARFFFESRGHKRARATIVYGLGKGEGFVVVTGAVGAGKTTLIEHLLASGKVEDAALARISTTQLESANLLQAIAYALALPTVAATKAGVLRDLKCFLEESARQGRRVLLIVDEVQNLSPDALEEMRMLSNFQENERALLQMLLVGQPEFRQRLAGRDCEQIRQRVIASYHLEALAPADVPAYVRHRLEAAGAGAREIFTPAALDEVARESGGVPRRINRLCDRLLLYGYLEGETRIDAPAVAEVAAEMRQEALEPEPAPSPSPDSQVPASAINGATPAEASNGAGRVLSGAEINGHGREYGEDRGTADGDGDGDGDYGTLLRTIADLRADLARYRDKVERIRGLVAREQGRLNTPPGRS